jgi:hypothetical protein
MQLFFSHRALPRTTSALRRCALVCAGTSLTNEFHDNPRKMAKVTAVPPRKKVRACDFDNIAMVFG